MWEIWQMYTQMYTGFSILSGLKEGKGNIICIAVTALNLQIKWISIEGVWAVVALLLTKILIFGVSLHTRPTFLVKPTFSWCFWWTVAWYASWDFGHLQPRHGQLQSQSLSARIWASPSSLLLLSFLYPWLAVKARRMFLPWGSPRRPQQLPNTPNPPASNCRLRR